MPYPVTKVAATWWECKYDTPKSWGRKTSRAYARPWFFRGDTQGKFKAIAEGWKLDNVDYLYPLRGMVLRMRHRKVGATPVSSDDSTVPDATVEPGSTSAVGWRIVKPPTCAVDAEYFQYRDTDPRKWGGVLLNKTFDLDAGVVVYVLRATPSNYGQCTVEVEPGLTATRWQQISTEQGALQPYVGIALPDYAAADGNTYRYQLMFPTITENKDGEYRQPFLRRGQVIDGSVAAATWKTVSIYTGGGTFEDFISRAQWASEAVEEAVVIRFLEGVLMINTGRIGRWWSYSDDILTTAPVGKMRFFAQAHQVAFLACQGYCSPLTGTIERNEGFLPDVPEGCLLADYTVNCAYTPTRTTIDDPAPRDGATVAAITSNDGTKITSLGATLTAGNPLRTPILYMIQERFTPAFETETTEPTSLRVLRATIRRRRANNGSVRGSTCTLTLDPAQDTADFKGGEVVTLRVFERTATEGKGGTFTVDEGSEGEGYLVFTGRVVSPQVEANDRAMVGDYKAKEIELQDESFRIGKKFARNQIGDIKNKQFKDAVGIVCGAFGIPEAKIKIDGTAYADATDETIIYEAEGTAQGQGDTNQLFEYTANGIAVLDKLAELRGDWTWSIEVDGTINFHPKPVYSEPDFTMRRTPATPDERVEEVQYRRNGEDFINHVYGVVTKKTKSKEADTEEQAEEHYPFTESWTDTASRYYVGDEWEEILVLKDKETANIEMARRIEQAKENLEVVTITIPGRELFAGQFVKSLMSDLPIPPGTVMVIGDEVRILEATSDEQKHTLHLTCLVQTVPEEEEGAE